MSRATTNKLVHITLNQGMNESVDDRLNDPSTLVVAQNVRAKKSLLRKRNGLTAVSLANVEDDSPPILGDGTTLVVEKPRFLSSIGETPVLGTTSGRLYASDDGTGSRWFGMRGYASTCTPLGSHSNTTYTNKTGTWPSSAINAEGYRATAWITEQPDIGSENVMMSITTPTGEPLALLKGDLYTRVDRVVVFAIANQFFLIWNDVKIIYGMSLTPSGNGVTYNNTRSAVATWGGVGTDEMFFDAIPMGASNWVLAYGQSDGSSISINKYDLTMSPTASNGYGPGADAHVPELSLYWDNTHQRLWMGFLDLVAPFGAANYAPSYIIYDQDLVVTKTVTRIFQNTDVNGPPLFGAYRDMLGAIASNSQAFYVIRENNGTGVGVRMGVETEAAGSGGDPYHTYGVYPVSKPDNYHRVWCVTADDYDATATDPSTVYWYTLLRFPGSAASVGGLGTRAPWVELFSGDFVADDVYLDIINASGGQYSTAAIGTDSSSIALPVNLGILTDVREFQYFTAEQAPHLHTVTSSPSMVTAGQPTEHFGSSIGMALSPVGTESLIGSGAAEIGFPTVPIITAIADVAGSPGIGAGTRSYKAVFEWVDVYGRRHQSKPSLPFSHTAATGKNVKVTVTTPQVGQRTYQGDLILMPVVSIYSTLDQRQEYLYATKSVYLGYSWAQTVDVTVSVADASLASQGAVYTDGDVLPNVLAPSNTFHVFSDERLWVGGGFTPEVLTCSKLTGIPTEPIAFTDSEAFQVVLPGKGTGLAFMDGSVIAFTARGIYQVVGDGPNDQGIGAFPSPRAITTSVGCSNYKSVLKTDTGILFQSNQGFWILPRGLGNPEFIGAAVRETVASYPTCLGACVYQDGDYYLARFLMAASGSTSSAVVIVYDLYKGIWYKDVHGTLAISEIGVWPTQAAMMLENLSTVSGSSPLLLIDQTSVDDAGTFISERVQTAWIYPFGPGGYGHVRKVMMATEYIGRSTVTLAIETDANAAQSASWDIQTSGVSYRAIDVASTKCTCCRVTLSDATSGSNTLGHKLLSLTLEVESDGGIRLLDISDRV